MIIVKSFFYLKFYKKSDILVTIKKGENIK